MYIIYRHYLAASILQSPATLSQLLIFFLFCCFLKVRFCDSFWWAETWFHCCVFPKIPTIFDGGRTCKCKPCRLKKSEVSESINSCSWGQSCRFFKFFWRLLSWMWNAWGYNTEQRPNHQVVKFLNAIICVPTVSCGYKIVPKGLEVREYEAQPKQILSSIFSPLSTQMLQSAFPCWQASMFWPSRGISLCVVPWAASHLPGRCHGTWQRWLDVTLFAQCSEWRITNILLPKNLPSSAFLSKIPIKALTLNPKGTYSLKSKTLCQARCLIKDWKSLAPMRHSLSSFICHMSVPDI